MSARIYSSIWPSAVIYEASPHPGGFGTQANPLRRWFYPQNWQRYMALGFLDPLRPLYDIYRGAGGTTPAPFAGPIDGQTVVYGYLNSANIPQVKG